MFGAADYSLGITGIRTLWGRSNIYLKSSNKLVFWVLKEFENKISESLGVIYDGLGKWERVQIHRKDCLNSPEGCILGNKGQHV